MKIVETNLAFSALTHRENTKRIIIHHSDSETGDAKTFHGWHLAKGWAGIGYHFVIKTDGTIQRGRPEDTIGAHSGPNGNGDSIGVCLVGDFTNHKPTEAQMVSLVWLIKDYLNSKYGELKILGHKDVMATACPGAMFPWADLNKRLEGKIVEQWKLDIMAEAEKEKLVMGEHNPDDSAPKWFVLAVALNLLKKLEGK
jgi:N-acetyl-anhydromuramyl-L-alanine amidase AmpD